MYRMDRKCSESVEILVREKNNPLKKKWKKKKIILASMNINELKYLTAIYQID